MRMIDRAGLCVTSSYIAHKARLCTGLALLVNDPEYISPKSQHGELFDQHIRFKDRKDVVVRSRRSCVQ